MGWAVGGITGFFVFRLFVCFETASYPVAQARMRHHALFSFKIYYHCFSLFPLATFFLRLSYSVAQVWLKLIKQLRLALNSWSPQVVGLQVFTTTMVLCGVGNQRQDLVCSRKAFYQLDYFSSPLSSFFLFSSFFFFFFKDEVSLCSPGWPHHHLTTF